MPKYEVTQKGIFVPDEDGIERELPKGKTFEADKFPALLVGKVRELPEAIADGEQVAVTNPENGGEPAVTRLEIFTAATAALEKGDFLQDGRPDLRALNDLLEEGVEKFTSDERNTFGTQLSDQASGD
ncbi:MAG: hypothetical protein JXR13_15110 [Thalassovita sp.]